MYTINPAADNSPDEPFFGYRLYWSQSYGGAHLAAYEDGLAQAAADLEADTTDNYDALKAVEHSARDLDWNARADGYNYGAREKHRDVRR